MVATTISSATNAFANGPDLMVNNMLVVHFVRSLGTLGPAPRAAAAVRRLRNLPYWGEVSVVKAEGRWQIAFGSEPVFSLGVEDAADLRTSPDDLANLCASRLRQAMDLPPLRVSDNFVQLPVGKSRLITVVGTAASKVTATSSDPRIATVTRQAGGYSIRGVALGATTVLFNSGTLQENVQVTIEPYAATFPQNFQAEVCGAPASEETVRGAAEAAVKTRLQTIPNAKVTFGTPTFAPLSPGKFLSVRFKVSATAANGIPNSGDVTVTVENKGDLRAPANYLWYSNKPETVRHFQSLFSASLVRGNTVRMLYHHLDGTSDDMYLRVEAVNDSKLPAELSIIPGDSKPLRDPVDAGLAAACQFMRGWMTGSAEVVTIPPGAVLPISFRRLSPNETASGLCELRLISGPDSLQIRADALPPLQLDDRWSNTIFTSTPWHEVGTHPLNMYDDIPSETNNHVYADPWQKSTFEYKVGGRHSFYRVGTKPLSQVDKGGSLDGNYGVFDSVDAMLTNPTDKPAEVELSFIASAGYTGAVFLVDGEMKIIHQIRPEAEAQIGKFHLNPGETRKVSLMTIPLSGSSYPATIVARALSDF